MSTILMCLSIYISSQAYDQKEIIFNGDLYTYIPNDTPGNFIQNREQNDVKDGGFVFKRQGYVLFGQYDSNVPIGKWITHKVSNISYNRKSYIVRSDSFIKSGVLVAFEEFGIYWGSSFLTKYCLVRSGEFDCQYPHTKLIHWYVHNVTKILFILGILFVFRIMLNLKIALKREHSYSAARTLAAFIFYWKDRFSDEKRLVLLANIFNLMTVLSLSIVLVFHLIVIKIIL